MALAVIILKPQGFTELLGLGVVYVALECLRPSAVQSLVQVVQLGGGQENSWPPSHLQDEPFQGLNERKDAFSAEKSSST